MAKRNGKIPPRLLQIPVEEEAKCHRDPAGEQEVRLGAISFVLPPVPSSRFAKGTFSTFHTFVTANIPISQLVAG